MSVGLSKRAAVCAPVVLAARPLPPPTPPPLLPSLFSLSRHRNCTTDRSGILSLSFPLFLSPSLLYCSIWRLQRRRRRRRHHHGSSPTLNNSPNDMQLFIPIYTPTLDPSSQRRKISCVPATCFKATCSSSITTNATARQTV